MTSQIRVGIVIGQLHRGGTERQVYELASRMRHGPCLPMVYCLSQHTDPFGPLLTASGVPLRILPRRRSLEVRRILKLARCFREDRLDLVHAVSFHANFYACLSLLLAHRCPLISSNRVSDFGGQAVSAWVNRIIFRRSERIVTNSEDGKAFTSRSFRVPPDRIEVIPNCVDAAQFASPSDPAVTRASLGIPAAAPVIGLMGRVVAQKRVDLFLEVARIVSSRLPDSRFLVVGEGDLLESMKNKSAEMGLEGRVAFTGGRDDVPDLLAATDLLMLTSDFEGLPNVVMEAMAAGRPVVATDIGGCRELIREGVDGRLAPAGNPDLLAERALDVLASPDRGREMGKEGQRRVRSEFSAERMVHRFEELFLRVLGDSPGRKTAPGPKSAGSPSS